ncbi:hypothetical protein Gorai_016394, partial [Gossypium raimondii]|nr:hypothetical protein [Gossypium raimondii]
MKASLSWAQQFELFLNRYKVIPLNSVVHSHSEGNWVHLFSDRAVARDFGNASVGELVRDSFGKWIFGFNCYLGKCSPFEAEFWGILDKLLILLGYKGANIRTNNLEVVTALSMKGLVDLGITLLRRIQKLMSSGGQWVTRYVPRECNSIADRLAKLGLIWQLSLQIFKVPPDAVPL